MSQESLGKAIGLDQQYISKLERGVITEITVTTLARLADALGESMDYLAGRRNRVEEKLSSAAVA
jgi:transcriptional regulator with XRE-family HTH domain